MNGYGSRRRGPERPGGALHVVRCMCCVACAALHVVRYVVRYMWCVTSRSSARSSNSFIRPARHFTVHSTRLFNPCVQSVRLSNPFKPFTQSAHPTRSLHRPFHAFIPTLHSILTRHSPDERCPTPRAANPCITSARRAGVPPSESETRTFRRHMLPTSTRSYPSLLRYEDCRRRLGNHQQYDAAPPSPAKGETGAHHHRRLVASVAKGGKAGRGVQHHAGEDPPSHPFGRRHRPILPVHNRNRPQTPRALHHVRPRSVCGHPRPRGSAGSPHTPRDRTPGEIPPPVPGRRGIRVFPFIRRYQGSHVFPAGPAHQKIRVLSQTLPGG